MSNLAAINALCHKRKTQVEMGKRPRPTIGVDGWPLLDGSCKDPVGGIPFSKEAPLVRPLASPSYVNRHEN